MPYDYFMNTATSLYFICYIPEFYANYINKNANGYNVLEKVVMLTATGFGLGYSIAIQNNTLIINYGPLFALDTIALFIRIYYAYRNRGRDVRALSISNMYKENQENQENQENPMHDIENQENQENQKESREMSSYTYKL
jgi:hypothetical protein